MKVLSCPQYVLILVITSAATANWQLPNAASQEAALTSMTFTTHRRELKQESARSSVVVRPLIIDGSIVQGTVEYMASLRNYGGSHFCGGTLIHPRVVLTAAHCVEDGINPWVDIGRRAQSGDDGSGYETIQTERTIIHENYVGKPRFYFDIALLVLKRTTDRSPIRLSGSDYCFQTGGCEVQILGWGSTEYSGTGSTYLLEAFPRSVGHDDCTKAYGSRYKPESMVCAGDLENGGVDACFGDSGGPMIYSGEQIGIVSWGVGCGEASKPGVYASIPKLLPWINSKLGELDNPPEPAADPCECAEDGFSSGIETNRKGCKQHLLASGDTGFFCMVVGGTECSSATPSKQFLGTAWKDC